MDWTLESVCCESPVVCLMQWVVSDEYDGESCALTHSATTHHIIREQRAAECSHDECRMQLIAWDGTLDWELKKSSMELETWFHGKCSSCAILPRVVGGLWSDGVGCDACCYPFGVLRRESGRELRVELFFSF